MSINVEAQSPNVARLFFASLVHVRRRVFLTVALGVLVSVAVAFSIRPQFETHST